MPDPTVTQLTPDELELGTVDPTAFPYQKMRGMLYWNGSAWVKWTGNVGIDQTTIGTTNGVTVKGFVSTNNSSTAPLGISGVFTGTADDCRDYSSVIVSVFSNRVAAANGVSMQFSSDGTNWDHAETYSYPATGKFSVVLVPRARYFRIVYTNGALAQASFRLQTVLRPSYMAKLQFPATWSVGIASTNNEVIDPVTTYPVPLPFLTVNSQNHQIWSAEHPENNSANGQFFPQNQGDLGDLHTSLTTIRGTQTVEVGHGTTAAVAKAFPTNQSGAQRIAQAGARSATLANISASATSVTLQALNTARAGLILYNDSSSVLYLKYGSTASATSFTYYIGANTQWEMPMPMWTGIVTGIWASATGSARVTETS